MAVADADARVAIYWDFENIHACVVDELRGEGAYRAARYRLQEPLVDLDPVVEYAATFGRVVVHRAYGNWQYFSRYRHELQAHAIDLVQLFPLTGWKNGADIRLVLDVAEDLQQAHVTHVIVVASDSDYTSLAQRCRKLGRLFIGIGTSRTVGSYQFACDEFRRYRDLALATASPAAPEPAAAAELAALDDAAELVTRAVRRLAAGRGEAWALKAAVRPMVKRLDPAFDERSFGLSSFTELLKALDGYLVERVGEHDHELAVRADIDGLGEAAQRPAAGSPAPGTEPVALIERQLRRRGLRLPADRQLIWTLPELVTLAFAQAGSGLEESFESLRTRIAPAIAERGLELSEVDFNKLKGIFWRARIFELHGHDKGISLRIADLAELRLRLITVLLEHLADPAGEDPAVLAEALFGPAVSTGQRDLITQAIGLVLAAAPVPDETVPDETAPDVTAPDVTAADEPAPDEPAASPAEELASGSALASEPGAVPEPDDTPAPR
jgi:hypothetical protein